MECALCGVRHRPDRSGLPSHRTTATLGVKVSTAPPHLLLCALHYCKQYKVSTSSHVAPCARQAAGPRALMPATAMPLPWQARTAPAPAWGTWGACHAHRRSSARQQRKTRDPDRTWSVDPAWRGVLGRPLCPRVARACLLAPLEPHMGFPQHELNEYPYPRRCPGPIGRSAPLFPPFPVWQCWRIDPIQGVAPAQRE